MKRMTVVLGVCALVVGSVIAAPTAAARSSLAAPIDDAGPTVFVGELTIAQLAQLRASGIDREDLSVKSGAASGTAAVEVVLNPVEAGKLQAKGIPLTEKQVGGQSTSQRLAEQAAAPGPVFRPYSGPGGLKEELESVARQYPDLVKLVVIGKTVQGKDIVALKVTKDARKERDGKRPAVLYSAAQHAREWITPEMDRRLLHYYLDNYRKDKNIRRIMDTTELWFVPVANPDGYDYTFTEGHRLWRKNLHDNDGDGVITGVDGVDPNRNYPTKWGYDDEGSSRSIGSEVYRGAAPASEPETKALDQLMRRIGFAFLVNYHSAAELLLYGVGWQVATPTPDDLLYETIVGDDAHPAVPGYDPDISAELYTTNGETTEHAHIAYGTLAFTPEMSTCQTASAVDPTDAFEPDDCLSVFNFPDSEPLVQAEFEKNIPFAVAVATSAKDPSNPVSVVGLTAPNFQVDAFSVSYGTPQEVAVTARRDIRQLSMSYRINGGRERSVPVREWRGGERYGDEENVYYGEFRGTVRGTKPGDSVEVWFTGNRRGGSGSSDLGMASADRDGGGRDRLQSEHFTYTQAQDSKASVLVLANEDYEGVNPTYPASVTGPKYAQSYVDALTSAGVTSTVWDVSKQGVPHDLGVLDHFKAVVWYLGDNRLTQDPEDEFIAFGNNQIPNAAVAERAQYLTLSVRDYLNAGGKLAFTGETAGYYGILGSAIGGIYYGLDGAPDQECAVTQDPTSDCLLLADDFTQYYLGANARSTSDGPSAVSGVDVPLVGTSATFGGPATVDNPLNEAGTFTITSASLPVDQFPQFRSWASSLYSGAGPGPFEPLDGAWYAGAVHADDAYMRLTRAVDLGTVSAADIPTLQFALSYDTEEGYDNVIVEAHTVGQDNWTTLPETGGLTNTDTPTDCDQGFLLAEHPFLGHYLTAGDPCLATGSTGNWNRMTGSSDGWRQVAFDLSGYAGQQVEVAVSYVTDPASGGVGVFVDDTRLIVGGQEADAEGFETSLGPWSTPGQPAGSPPNIRDFVRTQSVVGASVSTPDSVLLGFGIEQIADPAERSAVLGKVVDYLLSS